MGTDELTRIHELAKRVTLLEKMVLRQQSRIDELTQALEVQHAAGASTRPEQEREDAKERAAQEEAARSVPSVSDLLDEEMKRELARAYARAGGGRESAVNDQAKQTEAARKKTAEATLAGIPQHELRERTPEERTADFVRDYNALYDVPGTMFQKKKAQDDFIRDHEVQGMRCTNMQLRHSRPELEPRFVAVTPTRDADYWGMPLGNNLFAVVPNPFLVYGEEMHTAGGMREAFNSNYRLGNTYGRFTIKEAAIFQFGTIGKVFRRGQLEAEQ